MHQRQHKMRQPSVLGAAAVTSLCLLGYFPLYTTEQVMEIAKEQLGDFTLSDEMKEYYGIL